MTRHPDWPKRLHVFIEAARERPFSWGVHDCSLFAASWVLEATGTDPAERFRGKYKTASGSVRALKRYGEGTIELTTVARLGLPLASPLLAQRGDVVLACLDQGDTLGVCVGQDCAFVGPDGLGFRPLVLARLAWRI